MRSSFLAASCAAIAALFVASGFAQVSRPGARGFTAAALTAPPTTGWPTNGGNLYNQRYSPLKTISRDTVAQLKGVWRTRLRGSGAGPQYSGFAQPLVADGVAYVSTGANDVFALAIDTGEILWQYSANIVREHHLRLLRVEQQGRRAQRRQGVHRPARREAGGARSGDR